MRFRPWLIASLWIISLIGTAGASGYVTALFLMRRIPPPPSALADNITEAYSDPAAEFNQRVKAAFKVGSFEAIMVKQLQSQGFDLMTWMAKPGEEKTAIRIRPAIPCLLSSRISWRADEEGRLIAIRGWYDDKCSK